MNSEAMIGKIESLKSVKQELLAEIRKVIVGQDAVVEKVLIGLFANGHMLIEGVPGLAKPCSSQPSPKPSTSPLAASSSRRT